MSPDILAGIESIRWHLEHIGHVYAVDVSSYGSGESNSVSTRAKRVGGAPGHSSVRPLRTFARRKVAGGLCEGDHEVFAGTRRVQRSASIG